MNTNITASRRNRISRVALLLCATALVSTGVAKAASIDDLEAALNAQQKALAQQSAKIDELRRELAATKAAQASAAKKQAEAQKVVVTAPALTAQQSAALQQLEVTQKADEKKKADLAKYAAPESLSFSPTDGAVVTIYGAIDAGVFFQNGLGGPNLTYKPSGKSYVGFMGNANNGPWLGMRGVYQLSDGYTAGFDMAGGMSYTSAGTPTYSPFNKLFNVSVGTPVGTFYAGEQNDPAWGAIRATDPHEAKQTFDPIAAAWAFGTGTSGPQANETPSNAFGYKYVNGALTVGLLYKPDANSNATATVPLLGNLAVGQQESIGVTYDDGKYLLSGGFQQKWGATTTVRGVDVRNAGIGGGVHVGNLFFRGGIEDVYLPFGVPAAPLGVGSPLWTNITKKQNIVIEDIGVKWFLDDVQTIDVSIFHAQDTVHQKNETNTLALGYEHKYGRHLTWYINGGALKAGSQANPLTVGTTPGNDGRPGHLTLGAASGVIVRY